MLEDLFSVLDEQVHVANVDRRRVLCLVEFIVVRFDVADQLLGAGHLVGLKTLQQRAVDCVHRLVNTRFVQNGGELRLDSEGSILTAHLRQYL